MSEARGILAKDVQKVNRYAKIGIGLIVVGIFLLVMMVALLLMFAVGASENPPLPSPLGTIVGGLIQLGIFWYFFVLAGVAFIIIGAVAKRNKKN